MMNYRVIPRLDIKGPNLVKGIHLEGLRVLGKPWQYALQYYRDGADELIYIDVVASLYGRNNLEEIVRRTAENIFIPLTVVGGIREVDDIKRLLRAGADKVGINTAATQNPELLRQAARRFGSQCVVSSIEAKWVTPERCECFTDNGREATGLEVFDWARRAVELGAGEILLTSIDRDGTGRGFDLELTRRVAEMVEVPVIASGGCGRAEHLEEAVCQGMADAVSAASIFHYNHLLEAVDPESFADEGNIEFIRRARDSLSFMSDRIQRMSVAAAKRHLAARGIACRPDPEQAHA
jgi:cyclase